MTGVKTIQMNTGLIKNASVKKLYALLKTTRLKKFLSGENILILTIKVSKHHILNPCSKNL